MSLPSPSVSGSLLPNSAIAEGKVRHRRYQPKSHAFTYGVYMVWLDLEDVEALQQFPLWSGTGPNLVQFRRADYLSPGIPDLRQAVTERLVAAGCSERPHRIKLLTNLRNWGLTFNPVSFYFCFDVQDRPFAVLSEITNTPWDERHTYVHLVPAGEREAAQWEFSFAKCFHVSPFMPMDLQYQWRFRLQGDRVWIHMRLNKAAECQFDASLGLTLKPFTPSSGIENTTAVSADDCQGRTRHLLAGTASLDQTYSIFHTSTGE